jgi:hypothetical protein
MVTPSKTCAAAICSKLCAVQTSSQPARKGTLMRIRERFLPKTCTNIPDIKLPTGWHMYGMLAAKHK